jgi:hypothetical protein
MYKTFILIIFIISIIYVFASIARHIGENNSRYASEEIIYRYVPRPDNQEEQVFVSEIFTPMFDKQKTESYY